MARSGATVHPSVKRQIAEEALDRVDAHRLVDFRAVAGVLARVIADTPVHRGQGVVADDDLPGVAIAAGLRFAQPRLDVLAGRTGVVARRQPVHVERPHRADRRHAFERCERLDIGGHSGCPPGAPEAGTERVGQVFSPASSKNGVSVAAMTAGAPDLVHHTRKSRPGPREPMNGRGASPAPRRVPSGTALNLGEPPDMRVTAGASTRPDADKRTALAK